MEKLSVYFNNACPICRAEISHYRKHLSEGSDEIVFVDLAKHPTTLSKFGIDSKAAKRRLYALESGSKLISGIDAFISIWRRIPRYQWAARLTLIPGFYHLGRLIYERIAVPVLAGLNKRRERRNTYA